MRGSISPTFAGTGRECRAQDNSAVGMDMQDIFECLAGFAGVNIQQNRLAKDLHDTLSDPEFWLQIVQTLPAHQWGPHVRAYCSTIVIDKGGGRASAEDAKKGSRV